ncbi:MAG: hypothetical protein ACXWZJ_11840 [Solirubrobacterales bacterium]
MSVPRRREVAAVTALIAALLGSAVASAKPVADPPSRLLVTAREFSLTLSRPKLAPGEAIVQLYDFGEDPHDLAIQRVGGLAVFRIPETLPGETGSVRLRLRKASRYRLWCSLPGHADQGMFTTLRTTRKQRAG